MDYERIESLSKKLHTARIDVRIRTASNLLFKLESGIFDKDTISHSTCMSTLMDGINKSLEFILQNSADLADHSKEAYELLGLLLSLIKSTAADPSRNIAIDSATKVLDQLYQLKNVESVKGKLQMTLEEVQLHYKEELFQQLFRHPIYAHYLFFHRRSTQCAD